MIQSMTGYGKATAELPDKKINVEIKSLNSKAMDLSTRIAPAYREKEIEIRNEISKVLERGKVDFSLWIEKKESAESATPINQVLVEGYYKQIQAISENLGIPVPTDWFQTLLRMPDVMSKTEIQELTEEEWEGKLYRYGLEENRTVPCKIRAIPYCLWNNRGIGEMLVWIHQK